MVWSEVAYPDDSVTSQFRKYGRSISEGLAHSDALRFEARPCTLQARAVRMHLAR